MPNLSTRRRRTGSRFTAVLLSAVGLTRLPAAADGQTRPTTRPTTPPTTRPLAPDAGRERAYLRSTLVDAYDHVGSRDPRWDADARKVLALAVDRWLSVEPEPDPDLDWRIIVTGDRAIAAGCDDPAVVYHVIAAHRRFNRTIDDAVWTRLSANLLSSGYAPFLKVFGAVRLAEHAVQSANGNDVGPEVERLTKAVCENLPAAVAEPDFPQVRTTGICVVLTDVAAGYYGDRKPTMDRLETVLDRAAAGTAVPDVFLGKAYWRYSGDAGGVGWPATAGSPREQRHAVAKDHLLAALARDPHAADVDALMVGLLVDVGAPAALAEADGYYRRAIADDPDCHEAYYYKAASLNTGQPGSTEALAAFGRGCLATGRWAGRVPFVLRDTHNFLVYRWPLRQRPAGNFRARFLAAQGEMYRANPGLWQDAKSLYDGYLARRPAAVLERIEYATEALHAGDLDVTARELLALHANPDPDFKDLRTQGEMRATLVSQLRLRGMWHVATGDAKAALADADENRPFLAAVTPAERWGAALGVWLAHAQAGDRAAADQGLEALLKSRPTAPTDWPRQEATFLLGRSPEADLIAAAAAANDLAVRSDHTSRAWYYAGMKQLLAGDKASAAADFDKSVAEPLEPQPVERAAAQIEQHELAAHP